MPIGTFKNASKYMKMKPNGVKQQQIPSQTQQHRAGGDLVQCTEMVLVAHEGGTNEQDNESEPRVERVNER